MIYVFGVLCVLSGFLLVISIDDPKSFLGFFSPIVGIVVGFLGQTLYGAGVSFSTLLSIGAICVVVGAVLYYVGMFLTVLFLHWYSHWYFRDS